MGEWVLLLWMLDCSGWTCQVAQEREIYGYETLEDCTISRDQWVGYRSSSHKINKGVCIQVPIVTVEQDAD